MNNWCATGACIVSIILEDNISVLVFWHVKHSTTRFLLWTTFHFPSWWPSAGQFTAEEKPLSKVQGRADANRALTETKDQDLIRLTLGLTTANLIAVNYTEVSLHSCVTAGYYYCSYCCRHGDKSVCLIVVLNHRQKYWTWSNVCIQRTH